ncbi:MAG: hypothetical protein BRD50_00515 [Bacteroidetes bacterium SW_11_45_7]|nr:MAG: hypothetical protein BRD50_00515 [Bacteroidetes bacterium SW_11_45_7]
MDNPYNVNWSERSLRNALTIKRYLDDNFSYQEVRQFLQLLEDFETTVAHFPGLYPQSHNKPHLKMAVLNKNLSLFYTVRKDKIVVVAMQDNRQVNQGL